MSTHSLLVSLVAICLLVTLTAGQQPESIRDVQIASVTGCVNQYPVTVNCSVGVSTLRIQTKAGFPATVDWYSSPLFIIANLDNFTYFTATGVWPDLSDATNSSVFVNISARAYYPHITDVLVSLSFVDYYSVGQPTSVPFAGFAFRFEGPPTLTSIAGCDGSGQSTLNCVPDSSILELTGSGLLWYTSGYGAVLNIGNATEHAYFLQVVNDTYATLSLAWMYATLLKPQHYSGVLLSFNLSSSAYDMWGQRRLLLYDKHSLHQLCAAAATQHHLVVSPHISALAACMDGVCCRLSPRFFLVCCSCPGTCKSAT